MNPQEYFAILPLLLYGIGIAELVTPWRSFFEEKRPHVTFIITGLIILEIAFFNFYSFFLYLDGTFQSYFVFLSYLSSPLIFLMACYVYTPDLVGKLDTRAYFTKKFRLLMYLLAGFVASHFLYDFGWDFPTYMRLFFIFLLVLAGFTRKEWLIYSILAVRVIALIMAII